MCVECQCRGCRRRAGLTVAPPVDPQTDYPVGVSPGQPGDTPAPSRTTLPPPPVVWPVMYGGGSDWKFIVGMVAGVFAVSGLLILGILACAGRLGG